MWSPFTKKTSTSKNTMSEMSEMEKKIYNQLAEEGVVTQGARPKSKKSQTKKHVCNTTSDAWDFTEKSLSRNPRAPLPNVPDTSSESRLDPNMYKSQNNILLQLHDGHQIVLKDDEIIYKRHERPTNRTRKDTFNIHGGGLDGSQYLKNRSHDPLSSSFAQLGINDSIAIQGSQSIAIGSHGHMRDMRDYPSSNTNLTTPYVDGACGYGYARDYRYNLDEDDYEEQQIQIPDTTLSNPNERQIDSNNGLFQNWGPQ